MYQSDDLTLNNLAARIKAPTPKFFKRLRAIGLALAAAGTAILSAPVVLPAAIVCAGGYILTAGLVISAISQTTKDKE